MRLPAWKPAGRLASVAHLTYEQLEAGLEHVRGAPADEGTLELIARRPASEEREVLEVAVLDLHEGLAGDNWRTRGSTSTKDGAAHPDKQLNIMNARAAALVAHDPDRRALAGDQLYLDIDLSHTNLPAGTRLQIGGSAVIEITAEPHTGCGKFRARFGPDALKFVNSGVGKALRLRGACAKVVVPGQIRRGDPVRRLSPEA